MVTNLIKGLAFRDLDVSSLASTSFGFRSLAFRTWGSETCCAVACCSGRSRTRELSLRIPCLRHRRTSQHKAAGKQGPTLQASSRKKSCYSPLLKVHAISKYRQNKRDCHGPEEITLQNSTFMMTAHKFGTANMHLFRRCCCMRPLTVGSPSSLPALGPPLGQPLGQPMAHSVGPTPSFWRLQGERTDGGAFW